MLLLASKLFYFPSFLSLFAKVTCSRNMRFYDTTQNGDD